MVMKKATYSMLPMWELSAEDGSNRTAQNILHITHIPISPWIQSCTRQDSMP